MSADTAIEPVRVERVRWACPFCKKSKAKKTASAEHIATCHRNPVVHACSTCVHFTRTPCCSVLSDECGCKGLNSCAVNAFPSWRFNDHDTHAPDPNGWWTHVVDFVRECSAWTPQPEKTDPPVGSVTT